MKSWALNPDKIHVLDGGMGSMLQSRGLQPGMAPEWMILEQPHDVIDVHLRYIEAGSELIETNTFGATRHKLAGFGLDHQTETINKHAVELCKKAIDASGTDARVVGSIGPIGELLAPLGTFSPEEAYLNFDEQCRYLVEAGADLLNIETMSDPMELKLAVMAALNHGVPVMAEASFMANGRMLSGTQPEVVAAILDGFNLAALGVNCSLGPQEITPLLLSMAKATSVPLVVQPNAGIPYLNDQGQTVFPLGPEAFGQSVEDLIKQAMPAIVGGCCGTTPEHIAVLRGISSQYRPRKSTPIAPWIAGRCSGFAWTGDMPEDCITFRPIGHEQILLGDNSLDIFGAVAHCKQNKTSLIILDMDAWKGSTESLPQWIREFQSYFSGALGFVTDDIDILKTILTTVVGRPVVRTSIAREKLPEVLQRVPGVYLP